MKVLQGDGIMLKKFWNYQRLLSASVGSVNAKKQSKLNFVFMFVFMGIFSAILDGGEVLVYPITIILWMVYAIVNSQNKLFEIVPVSKLYSLINIYLYVFIMNLAITVVSIIGLIPVKILFQSTSVGNISILSDNWEAILITGCIATIIASILLPTFFIRLNFLRKALTISVVSFVTIALVLFKNTLPVVTGIGKINFLERINTMPYYNETLLILVCVCIVIIPISIFISYRLYKGKRCLAC